MNRKPVMNAGKVSMVGILVLAGICLASGAGVGLLYWAMRDDIEAKSAGIFQDSLADVLGSAREYGVVGEYSDETAAEDKVYVNDEVSPVLFAGMGTAQGYQSVVQVLVSVEAASAGAPAGDNPRIHRLKVVASQETPGLGENIKAVEQDASIWAKLFGADGDDSDRQPHNSNPTRSAGDGETGTTLKAASEPPATEKPRPWFQEQFSGKTLEDLVVDKDPDTDKIVPLTGATITSRATTEAARDAVQRIIDRTREVYGQ